MMSQLSSRAGELKAQGAIEAAQDRNTKTSAQDAEDVMAAESKKAGIPALQFDPNASPEEKAAQARAVSSVPGTPMELGDLLIFHSLACARRLAS